MEQLTYLQQYAENVLKLGFNVFLTGDAGTGKTYTITRFINYSRSIGKNVMVLAPTGIASGIVGGVTMHSQFKIPLGPIIRNINPKKASEELENTDILIIEEISMCRIDVFDYTCKLIFKANEERKRRGKKRIQLVLVGDFFQLPPVITEKDREVLNADYKRDIGLGFAFDSEYWHIFNFKNIILLEVMRQSNTEFIEYLNRIRRGDKTCIDEIYEKSSKEIIPHAINMCGTNKEVNAKNNGGLNLIQGNSIEYDAYIENPYDMLNYNLVAQTTPAELILNLKIGARVMALVNEPNGYYYNGSMGVVTGLYQDRVTVQMDNGFHVEIRPYTWDVMHYELDYKSKEPKLDTVKIGAVTQFPLRLAYAITIHKSQGQTFEAVNLSPYSWDCGQLYVALSRVRSLDKLHIKYTIDTSYLVTSLNVINFHNEIAKTANQSITQDEIDKINNQTEVYTDIITEDKRQDMNMLTSMLKSL